MTVLSTRVGNKIDLSLCRAANCGTPFRSYFGTIKFEQGMIRVFDFETHSEYCFPRENISEMRIGPATEAKP